MKIAKTMYAQITKDQAEYILNDDSRAILIDIRDRKSFENGHVQGAILLTQDNLFGFFDETPKDTPLLIICYHGNSSQVVAETFSLNGFSKVYSVIGGYEGWVAD